MGLLKIRNAKKVTYDDKVFDSKLEQYAYEKLMDAGFKVRHTPKKYVLQPAFVYRGETIKEISYTPDLILPDRNIVIETKGYPNDVWPVKVKMFKYVLAQHSPDTKFVVLKTQKEVNKFIEELKS